MTMNHGYRVPPTREIYSWAEIIGFAVTAGIIVALMALATGAI